MFRSNAYSIQMSFPVPDSERRVAEKIEECLEDLLARLKSATEYLDLIYYPFKKVQSLDNEQIVEHRNVFRKYRDEIKNKFEDINKKSFRCMTFLSEFSKDRVMNELLNVFADSMKMVNDQAEILINIFDNLNSAEFKDHLIAAIDSVKKQVNQSRQLINDRILEHIDTNILAKNWMSDLSQRYDEKIKSKLPLLVELFRERQQALKQEEPEGK